jgi:hypothetical protein
MHRANDVAFGKDRVTGADVLSLKADMLPRNDRFVRRTTPFISSDASKGTTASQLPGIGAPVMILIATPSPITGLGVAPAGM